MVSYEFENGQRVRLSDGRTGYVSSRVPGNGTGSGWYYVQVDVTDGGGEEGPLTADELESE